MEESECKWFATHYGVVPDGTAELSLLSKTKHQQPTNKEKKAMNTASSEWAAQVAARNEIEMAKARGDAALMEQGYLPLDYGEQPETTKKEGVAA